MNEVWSATHRTKNGMLKILKNLIIWMSFRYNQTLKKGLNSAHLSLEASKLLIMLNLSLGTHTPIPSHYTDTHTHTFIMQKENSFKYWNSYFSVKTFVIATLDLWVIIYHWSCFKWSLKELLSLKVRDFFLIASHVQIEDCHYRLQICWYISVRIV